MKSKNILIIGSGAWGTALAQVLSDNKHNVFIYGNDKNQIQDINQNHQNSQYFGDISINWNIKASTDLNSLFQNINFDVILFVVPSVALDSVLNDVEPYINKSHILINAGKGFDNLGKTLHTIIKEKYPNNEVLSLLGPSHAEEVILRKLTFVDICDDNDLVGYMVAEMFDNFYFKTKVINDTETAEFGCIMKNAVALMSGIYEGLGFGDNARAALYTDGLNEMLLLASRKRLNERLLLGYTGAGDLAVTCYSQNSRNFQAGVQIGKSNYSTFEKNNTKTVEGIRTVKYLYEEANKLDINLPIINCLYHILYENVEPLYAVDNLINKKSGLYK